MSLTINPDKVCFAIAKSREINVKVAPEELADDGDDIERILEDYADDATYQELKAFLDVQGDDVLRELIALTWIGCGDDTRTNGGTSWMKSATLETSTHRTIFWARRFSPITWKKACRNSAMPVTSLVGKGMEDLGDNAFNRTIQRQVKQGFLLRAD